MSTLQFISVNVNEKHLLMCLSSVLYVLGTNSPKVPWTAQQVFFFSSSSLPFAGSPPDTCLQYHTGLMGRIETFNYQATGDNHLNNQQ